MKFQPARTFTVSLFSLLGALSAPAWCDSDVVVGDLGYRRVPSIQDLERQARNFENGHISLKNLQQSSHHVLSAGTSHASAEVPLAANAASAPQAIVEAPKETFVFQHPFISSLRIQINALYTLTPHEKQALLTRLREIPPAHLSGLTEITIRPAGYYYAWSPEVSGGKLTISATPEDKSQVPPTVVSPGTLVSDTGLLLVSGLGQGLGLYAYEHVLTPAERQDLQSIFADTEGAENAKFVLQSFYANYFSWGEQNLIEYAIAADLKTARENDVDPARITKAYPDQLQMQLILAALFSDRSGNLRYYTSDSQLRFGKASLNDQWLNIGGVHFARRGNTLIGFTTDPNLGHLQTWGSPIRIPEAVLNRIPKV